MLRTLLILTVVFLHTVNEPNIAKVDLSDFWTVFTCIFQDRLGRFAVPTLTMISAFLLFSSGLDLAPVKLYKKKSMTLVVPFFFFNMLYFAAQYVLEYATGWSMFYEATHKSHAEFINALIAYDNVPFNGALHFLRDLFVLVLLTPVFGLFLRRAPIVGFALVCAVFLGDLDGHLVNRDTMAVMFYLGGWAAVGKWEITRFDRFATPAIVVLIGACTAAVFLRVDNMVIYLLSPVLVWVAFSHLIGSALGNWAARNSRYSFFVFLAHTPVLHVLKMLAAKSPVPVPPLLYSLLATALVAVVLVAAYQSAMKTMPTLFNLMIGARAKGTVVVERRRRPRPAHAPVYSDALRLALSGGMAQAEAHGLAGAEGVVRG